MAFLEIGSRELSEGQVRDLLATDHPMVAEFRFERQGGNPGRNLNFALVIVPKAGVHYRQQRDSHGGRTEPVWKTLTGDVRSQPSSFKFSCGKSPCQVLARCLPSGASSLPQANSAPSSPPRAANSHSASVGRSLPAHFA